jgi:nitrogen fixation/metabolism regulation signal transduction histidine kinase
MDGAFKRRFALLHAARTVLRVVPAAVVVLDRRLRFRVTNGAARRLFDPGGESGRTARLRNAHPRGFGVAVEQLAAAARIRKQRLELIWPSPDAALYRVTADPAPEHVVIVAQEVSPAEGTSARQLQHPRAVDINEIVKRVSEVLRRMLGTRISIELNLEPALWPVFGDPAQLEQLLMNVAMNSRDAMPAGGTITMETASVAVGGSSLDRPGLRPGSYVMIRVTDTGPGIEPDVLPHIFEPFFTTRQSQDRSGLGLSTVYGIVKQSGGYVYADSPPGAGAHLIVLLPRYHEPHT